MNNLTIYRASAGSGKTHTLTSEYVKLLLNGHNSYHRRILAVTFTNKATGEMKSRIVRDLHNMAYRRADEKYIQDIVRDTKISENDLPDLASKALAYLLHDYSHFSIFTIDSFFQRVIRSFAREMGLYSGYDVELDQNSALDEAANLMLDDIDNNEFLKEWLVEWAKRKIEDGKSWNIKSDVLRLGSEIFSEELQNIDPAVLNETTDKESLQRFRVKLNKLQNDYLDYLQKNGQKAMDVISRYGLYVDSFSQKTKGVGGYFLKCSQRQPELNKFVKQALDSVEKGWYSKSSPQKNAIIDAYYGNISDKEGNSEALGALLKNMTDYQNQHAHEIATTNVILKQINVLGVICDLMHHVSKYARDQNLFLISEASGFIKKIIADADAPFIYERVGNFFNHYMIDEFQDTSSVQWNNFRPLIDNSIASGYHDWIVGDVKQSIYRWRNTDWKILSHEVENNVGSQYVDVKNLDKNWRSAPEIVRFNNDFFREATLQMRTAFLDDEKEIAETEFLHGLTLEMSEAYRDCCQNLPDRHKTEKGYVRLEMIAEGDDAEKTWRETVLEELPRRIEQLQDLGYSLSDIAIIVRENKEAQSIADMLLEYRQAHPNSKYRYDVLSNESLLICNSPVVKFLIAVMRYMIEPDDIINIAYLNSRTDNLSLEIHESISLGIFELSEKIINQFNLYEDTGQAPFLQAFQDILLQYTRRESSDIRSFLEWWEAEKSRKFVAMPDNQDAIQLITIHKSKGLEFDAVIIPFCDWQLCKSGKTLWCSPSEAPFSDIKLLPLKFESALRDTIFVKDYLREKMLSYIDNLNLLYVAFTRASKALFVTLPQQKKDGFSDVKNLIHRVFFQNSENTCLEFGELDLKKTKTKSDESAAVQELVSFATAPFHDSKMKEIYTQFSEDDGFASKGRLLHDIFRKMVTFADLEQSLNAMIMEGRLPEAERTHIVDAVHRALENPTVRRWFDADVEVKTEAEILLPDGSTARPDRVIIDNGKLQVIDYKFGKQKSEKHRQQVALYMEHLQKMGYGSVAGFLWYVAIDEVIDVIKT